MDALTPETDGPLADVALVELLNRVLDRGVVITGEVVISVANVDLLYLNLSLLLSSFETLDSRTGPGTGAS